MSEQAARPAVPQQWSLEGVKDGAVVFDCPSCKEHHKFDARVFTKDSAGQIDGLTKTDQVVRRTYGQNFLAFVLALIVYYYAHRWINGEGTPLNQGILIPVFIAVFAYSILKPFFSAGLSGGKGIPIYSYRCSQCVIPIHSLHVMEDHWRFQRPWRRRLDHKHLNKRRLPSR